MSVINRADAIKALEDVGAMFPYRIPGVAETYRPYNEAWNDAIDKAEQAIEALPDAEDGWIPYTGQHIENGRYLVQIETGVIVCGTYSENGFVFPFCSDVIVAFRPLPKPYEPKEDK